MKRKRKLLLILSILCVLAGGGSIFAAQAGDVYDNASLLTEDEGRVLNEKIQEFKEESGWNIYAVTTDDAQGKSVRACADDFFDELSPDQEDGVLFLIDMDNREIALTGSGEAMRYLTDVRIDAILDEAYAFVSEAGYAECLETMVDETKAYYEAGIPKDQYNYDTETGKKSKYRSLTPVEIVIAVVIACVAGGMVPAVIVGRYQLKFGTYQYEYHEYGKTNLKVRDDRFINQTVTQRRINTENNDGGGGGGRSSTHTGSSGRSHVGGSRKF